MTSWQALVYIMLTLYVVQAALFMATQLLHNMLVYRLRVAYSHVCTRAVSP